MIEYLNSPEFRAALLVVVPTLLVLLRRVAPLLDLTAWPRWAQPIPPLLLAGLPVLVGELEGGSTVGAAVLAAVLEGLAAIGAWHAAKRLRSKRLPVAPVIVVSVALGGCAVLSEVESPGEVASICQAALLRSEAGQDLHNRGRLLALAGAEPSEDYAAWVDIACAVASVAAAAGLAEERGEPVDLAALQAARDEGLVQP